MQKVSEIWSTGNYRICHMRDINTDKEPSMRQTGKNSSDAEYKCEVLEIGMSFTCFKKSLAREFVAVA